MSAADVTPEGFERRLEAEVVDFQLARDILDAYESCRTERDALRAQLAQRPVALKDGAA